MPIKRFEAREGEAPTQEDKDNWHDRHYGNCHSALGSDLDSKIRLLVLSRQSAEQSTAKPKKEEKPAA